MDLETAHHILGTEPQTPPADRQAAYQRQRLALDAHLAQATLPVLQDRFTRALALLDQAYAAIEISVAASDLPVLRAMGAVGTPVSQPDNASDNRSAQSRPVPPGQPVKREPAEPVPVH